jgi:hypothetical protein
MDTAGAMQDWNNIKSITSHFGKVMDDWCTANSSSLSQQEVQNLIRSNYDTLRLTLPDNLEYYEPYNENPKEASFFRQLIRVLVFDWKSTLK